MAGVVIALASVWEAGGFENLTGQELVLAIGAVVLGFLTRDANRSSEESGAKSGVKEKLPMVLLLTLPFVGVSCATRPDGETTFLGLDAGQWGRVGLEAGKGAVVSGLPEYNRQRSVSESESGSESGKETLVVRP